MEITCPTCGAIHKLELGGLLLDSTRNYNATVIWGYYDDIDEFHIYRDCKCGTRLLLRIYQWYGNNKTVTPARYIAKKEHLTYKAKDGQVFTNKKDAVEHEELLARVEEFAKVRCIKHFDIESAGGYCLDFYYAANEEHLQLIIKNLGLTKSRYTDQIINGNIAVGEWIAERTVDSQDCRWEYQYIYTLSWLKEQLEKDLKVINEVLYETIKT